MERAAHGEIAVDWREVIQGERMGLFAHPGNSQVSLPPFMNDIP